MDASSAIVEFTRIYLAAFFTVVAAFYTLRITTRDKRVVQDVVFPGKRFSDTWWNHMVFRAFRMVIWLTCLLRLFFPAMDNYLGIFPAMNVLPVVLTGDILLTAGFLFTLVVHRDLGAQWRSGIDPDGPKQLRTDRLYRFSRNPMFLGIAIAQAGFFLALPSVFTGVCLVTGWVALHRQVMGEEAHLSGRFPDDYALYRRRVRRWL